jgi:hypothetical protein
MPLGPNHSAQHRIRRSGADSAGPNWRNRASPRMVGHGEPIVPDYRDTDMRSPKCAGRCYTPPSAGMGADPRACPGSRHSRRGREDHLSCIPGKEKLAGTVHLVVAKRPETVERSPGSVRFELWPTPPWHHWVVEPIFANIDQSDTVASRDSVPTMDNGARLGP